ncbi:structural maintenance of chromosomes protein 2 [Cladochytrium replicatum]|nr:structural maintenance of chromosomes protein 2 [Cladochytrium replicatum]
MHIKEVIIDGFKSYAQKTVVSGWDPSFNAITGLNGSGKSNVLDAICFVLGIKALSNLRAANLQELVYKKGQAGVDTATVAIVFDNSEKQNSPPGYVNDREITVQRQYQVGGKNKYFINGKTMKEEDVANLFQSVQLNVNNPHFLIMQGRITKVLNMKPTEILAMIEEAAGTRMYEEKKGKAVKTMLSKDKKMEEITEMLEKDIEPKLEQLREQKKNFLEMRQIEGDVDRVMRLVVAYDYKKAEDFLEKSQEKSEVAKEKIQTLRGQVRQYEADLKSFEKRLEKIAEGRRKEGGKYTELDALVQDLSKQVVRIKTKQTLQKSAIDEEQSKLTAKKTLLAELQGHYAQLTAKKEESLKQNGIFKVEHEQAEADIKLQEDLLSTLLTGMSASASNNASYMDQLKDAQQRLAKSQNEQKQSVMKIKHAKSEMQRFTPKARVAEEENAELLLNLKKKVQQIEQLKINVAKFNWDEEEEKKLSEEKSQMQSEVSALREKVESLQTKLISVLFEYRDPVPSFDRGKVKGLVANLVDIPKENESRYLAVETCAGGRLYNVVITDEVVGKQLIEHGGLKNRVTFIPLNKIRPNVMNSDCLGYAKEISSGKAELALNVIQYDQSVQNAMKFVFGNTLICEDENTAKNVTFNKDIRTRSVTLDGDTYDPSGQLSGGSRSQSSGILKLMKELKIISKELEKKEAVLGDVLHRWELSSNRARSYFQTRQQLDIVEHEYGSLQRQLESNHSSKILEEVAQLEETIEQEEKNHVEQQELEKKLNEMIKKLQRDIEELSDHREEKIESLKKELAAKKRAWEKGKPKFEQLRHKLAVADEEMSQMQRDIKETEAEIIDISQSVEDLAKQAELIRSELIAAENEHKYALEDLQKEQSKYSRFDNQSQQLEEERKERLQLVEDIKLDIQATEHQIEQYKFEYAEAKSRLAALVKEHSWILAKQQDFGKPGTPFEFEIDKIHDARKALNQMQDRKKILEKVVNREVMESIERLEKQEKELKQMFNTVKKDKKKIEGTMDRLDNFKQEKLRQTFLKVNNDFGLIFSDLLPGNTVKLQTLEGKTIQDGFEIKVCIGGVWKHSLTELSGGQRSLIALSLILALLQVKPAPMYILDEVDAALDLSHTQNIGHLFRTRFKGSQFIVVSLKEGMFNNANVLFRAKLRDGVSTIERTAERKRARTEN